MLTKEQVLNSIQTERLSQCLDGRDYKRLIQFFNPNQWNIFGYKLQEGFDPNSFTITSWNENEILNLVKQDVAFGFEKALDCRGISAGLMYNVVKMWMWILEDNLQFHDHYDLYGLPLFKAVAIKYDFPNEIGDDEGNESKYENYYEE